VAVRATRWRYDHPAALGGYEVADEVVREVIATRFGHGDFLPRATDRLSAKLIQPCLAGLANGLGCLHISAQIAAVQTSDVGLSFIDVSPQRCGV
jgi:hypothetical protein